MLPFILTSIAGLSTLIGTIFIFIKCDINKLTKYSLAFSSGIIISVSLFELLPESLALLLKNNSKDLSFIIAARSILTGIFISYILGKIVPKNKHNKLYRVGLLSALAIIIHNIPEGIITYLSSAQNITLGISITIAIALHNIPEGISISVPIYSATKNKKRAIFYTLISGIAEPLGAFLAFIFLKNHINDNIMGFILAFTAGIMLHIAIFELLKTSLQYNQKKQTIKFFILGVVFMIINHFLI